MEKITQILASATIAMGMTALASCTAISSMSLGSQAPAATSPIAAKSIPRAQNCGVLDAGTPTRFVCNGKVYTSYQLAKLREDEAKKYAAGQ